MTTPAERKSIALAHLEVALVGHALQFVIADGDLVTVVAHEAPREMYAFRTVRIADGRVVAEWSNQTPGSSTTGAPTANAARPAVAIGAGDSAANTVKVADFYRCVFDAQNPDAVRDFVTEDYHQHVGRIPTGRAGLEAFVRARFPDGPVPTPATASIPPAILMGEGDLVVIAAALPQPDERGGTYLRYLYDGYRVTGGLLAEHWSGVDPENPPTM